MSKEKYIQFYTFIDHIDDCKSFQTFGEAVEEAQNSHKSALIVGRTNNWKLRRLAHFENGKLCND